MAMELLAHELAKRGAKANVFSAGTLGWGGPATNHAVKTLADRGLDLSAHESRRMSKQDVDGADLIIGMTRAHVNGAIAHDPDAMPRTFVMGEIVRLGRKVGPRQAGQSVRQWCEGVHAQRLPNRPPGLGSDEIDDPVGENLDVYAACANRLEKLCAELAELLLSDSYLAQSAPETIEIDPVDDHLQPS